MSGYVVQSYSSSVTEWTCHSVIDDFIISKGKTTVYLFGSNQDVYICMKMTTITESSFSYYVMSDKEVNANNERVYIISSGTAVSNVDSICQTSSSLGDEEYNVMVKQGYEQDAKQYCPSVFLGNFFYTYDNGTGTSCGTGSEWDVCTNRTTMKFNYTQCATIIAYSDTEVFCVASVASSNVIYLTVFNNGIVDSVSLYRFTCMTISSSGSSLSVSLQKGKCDKGQSPTVRPTGGALASLTPYSLVLFLIHMCLYHYICFTAFDGDSSIENKTTTIASIIGALIAVLLAIIIIAVLFFGYIKFKEKKKKTHPEQHMGPTAYFVREFTFERIQNKLRRENESFPDSACTSVLPIDDKNESSKLQQNSITDTAAN
ncbi:uncharacterized protein LOC127736655 [Mytilus californianus]|uniref:uncharacterized protein LOC127736655 n=1 Tax=Mytilus californianus TaxID=6549 RepID=UPI002246CFDB|nr:uncharacterized protein LOC127736655 [Mytilus californianus]